MSANIAPTRENTDSRSTTTAPLNARMRKSRTLIMGIGIRSWRTTNSTTSARPTTKVTTAMPGSLPSARVFTP